MQDEQPDHNVAVPAPIFLTTASERLEAYTAPRLQDLGSIEMNAYRPAYASCGRIIPSSLPNPVIRLRHSSSSLGTNDFAQETGPPRISHEEAETREIRNSDIY